MIRSPGHLVPHSRGHRLDMWYKGQFMQLQCNCNAQSRLIRNEHFRFPIDDFNLFLLELCIIFLPNLWIVKEIDGNGSKWFRAYNCLFISLFRFGGPPPQIFRGNYLCKSRGVLFCTGGSSILRKAWIPGISYVILPWSAEPVPIVFLISTEREMNS